MSDLEIHVNRMIEWARTLNGRPERWSEIQIVEDPLFRFRGDVWQIPRSALMSVKQFEEKFDDLLTRGYSWINLNLGGVYKDKIIIFVEYPRQSSGCPKDKVSVNLSGPSGVEWDLSQKIVIIE